ncbi:hypothetical protein EI94DRAFT_1806533 [Lactarius quietus]|nr:hypothetical protein EI94DRAFT_1806533 [Lactarius quietus]
MVDWTLENVPAASRPQILEIGSGNGTLLFALRELARLIAHTRYGEEIAFIVCDFLRDSPPPVPGRPDASELWDLLLDKGTYDAIALGEKDEFGRSPQAAYPAQASKLLKDGGYLLITSCNFTEEELKASFITPDTTLSSSEAPSHALKNPH